MKRVVFLCTGNYYRSRFAEMLFNWLAKQRGLNWVADSSGLDPSPLNVGSISQHTVAGLSQLGVPITAEFRAPRKTAESDFVSADLVVAVKEAEHRAMVERSFPAWLERVEFWHVHDLDCAQPEDTLSHLYRQVQSLVDRLG